MIPLERFNFIEERVRCLTEHKTHTDNNVSILFETLGQLEKKVEELANNGNGNHRLVTTSAMRHREPDVRVADPVNNFAFEVQGISN